MSKYVNITVSTSLSTDFILEVPDDADDNKVKELAQKEVLIPNKYPEILDNFLKTRMRINIQGIDSMLKSWNVDEIEYMIDGKVI